jgi:hypothetical protein
LPAGTYRVWNSEDWATGAPPMMERSPLRGPVGRGHFPLSSSSVAWAASPSEAALVELDRHEGAYRTVGVKVLDLESLTPGTSTQPPLHFEVLAEGVLDQTVECGLATTRAACAALGGPCGWCEQTDGVHASRCTAGGPARACVGECAAWFFFDPVTADPPPSPPPPSPPGLSEADLVRLEAHSHAAAAEVMRQPPAAAIYERAKDALPHRLAAEITRVAAPEDNPDGPSLLWAEGTNRFKRMVQAFRQRQLLPTVQ